MYKVGDVIVDKKFRKERYTILEIHPERARYSVMIEPFPDVIDVIQPYYIGIDTLYDFWDHVDVYYRKQKLEKICTRLAIK